MNTVIKGSFIELSDMQITRCNTKFKQVMGQQDLIGLKLTELIEIDNIEAIINKLQGSTDSQINFLFLSNLSPNAACESGGVRISYGYLEKDISQRVTKIFMTNYLTWLHQIIHSWNCIYEAFSFLNQEYTQTIFSKFSPLSAFKALHPMFTMQKTYSTKLYAGTMLDTGRIFFNNRVPNRVNDYLANVLGSINSKLNKHSEKKYQEWNKFLIEDTNFPIIRNGEVYISNMQLHKSVIIPINGNSYLDNLLKQNVSLT